MIVNKPTNLVGVWSVYSGCYSHLSTSNEVFNIEPPENFGVRHFEY